MTVRRQGKIPRELTGDGRFMMPRKRFAPAYLQTFEEGRLRTKVEEALELLRSCIVCPRNCRVDRLVDQKAVCQSGRLARVTGAFPHFGEEDCLRGWKGSGTIFFAWCNLRCVFCQNYETSHVGEGDEATPQTLASLMLELQRAGCHNINLVTPEHVVPQILEALLIAVEHGLRLPLVYNTGAYDSIESMRLMDGVIDIYMPDFKLWDVQRSVLYLRAKDYPDVAQRVIAAMHRQVGELIVDENGLALRGVLVRHLVMPGMLDDTRAIMQWLANNLSQDTYVNVMDQYYPAYKALTDLKYTSINRPITDEEFAEAIRAAHEAGLWRLDVRWRSVNANHGFIRTPRRQGGPAVEV